jgi:prepilin-type N-terminal cleavage/methylation domain-containing protein
MGRRDPYGEPWEYEDDLFRKPMPPELIIALVIGGVLAAVAFVGLALRFALRWG